MPTVPGAVAPDRATLREGFLHPSGLLKIVRWARAINPCGPKATDQLLAVTLGPREVQMANSPATGAPLVTNGFLGVDVIRLAKGESFAPHTHPGDHLLIVVGGHGTITYGGRIYPTKAGEVYLIEGAVAHAVGAVTDHVILAVGAPHRAVGAPDRSTLVEYEEVTAEFGDLHCLICDKRATSPARLHETGCPHCPCGDCAGH